MLWEKLKGKIKLTANILFSGIGCQERGFRDSGIFDIDVINTSEISKESVLSYAAIHCGMTNEMVISYNGYPPREEMAQHLTNINLGYNPDNGKKFDWFKLAKSKKNDLEKYWLACKLSHNLGDISGIKELPYADLWTCSFPCTDISICGKMKGLNPDSGTRSSLLWENIRLLNKAKKNSNIPKYIMFENVKNLVSKKFINNFNDLLEILDGLGFNSYWSVINGKNCGVPQNRERVFVVSIRKDIDRHKFTFPTPFDIGIRLKDVLEKEVDEKYYLPDEKVKSFLKTIDLKKLNKTDNEIHQLGYINNYNGDANRVYSDNVSRTLKSEAGGGGAKTGWYLTENEILKVGQINSSQDGVVVSTEGVTPTHTSGHGNMPKILETPNISYCIDANYWHGTIPEQYVNKKRRQLIFEKISELIRIRKLTPRETWVLMGLSFEDCDKASNVGISNTHLYKQAGNGIITNCCALLAEHLYKAQYDDSYICTDITTRQNIRGVKMMYLGCAQRGRYQEDGTIQQQIEVRDDELSNAITTVQKDSLVIENFLNPPMN